MRKKQKKTGFPWASWFISVSSFAIARFPMLCTQFHIVFALISTPVNWCNIILTVSNGRNTANNYHSNAVLTNQNNVLLDCICCDKADNKRVVNSVEMI